MRTLLVLIVFLQVGCASFQNSNLASPPIWLEDSANPQTVDFVTAERKRVEADVTSRPEFESNYAKILKYYESDTRLPAGIVRGEHLYFLNQSSSHPRGVWQRIPLRNLSNKNLVWETLLDLDALAVKENQNWLFQSAQCLPNGLRCLLALSVGGGDAAVVREFNLQTKQFVKRGFELPLGKHLFKWLNENEVLLGTYFGPNTMSASGSARQIRVWHRGQPFEQSEPRFKLHRSDASLTPFVFGSPKVEGIFFVRSRSNSDKDFLVVRSAFAGEQVLDVPADAQLLALFNEKAIFFLRRDWRNMTAGSVLAMNLNDTQSPPSLLVPGQKNQMIVSAQSLKSHLMINVLKDLKSELLTFSASNERAWVGKKIELPQIGHINLLESDGQSDSVWMVSESYLQPPALLRADAKGKAAAVIFKLPPAFSGDQFERISEVAVSADGTRVPYTIVKAKNVRAGGLAPAILTGYGSLRFHGTETYLGAIGLTWLSDGGLWVFAHVRGGLELGPEWTLSASREKRPRAFEDFQAVAKAIVASGWTSPKKIGLFGFSKGGLLVGATATKYSEDFGAAVMRVPILDTLNFNRWPPGAAWVDELGDPANTEDAKFLKEYSPLENLENKNSLPSMLMLSATGDDRVHPAHSRRMIWKLRRWQEKNPRNITPKFYYYESPEGGHSLNNNPAQRAFRTALELTFMRFQLDHN